MLSRSNNFPATAIYSRSFTLQLQNLLTACASDAAGRLPVIHG
jgi:hypothetical protein